MPKKSAHPFICQHSLIQQSCDASLGCSLPRRNGIAVSEIKLNLMMHASRKKKKNCFAQEFISKLFKLLASLYQYSVQCCPPFLLVTLDISCYRLLFIEGLNCRKGKTNVEKKKAYHVAHKNSNSTQYCQWLRKYRKCNW